MANETAAYTLLLATICMGLSFWGAFQSSSRHYCGGLIVFSLPVKISTGEASDAPQSRFGGLPSLF